MPHYDWIRNLFARSHKRRTARKFTALSHRFEMLEERTFLSGTPLGASGIVATPVQIAPLNEGAAPASLALATFTDADGSKPASDFTASIDWGLAGRSADVGDIVQNGDGSYTVSCISPAFPDNGGRSFLVSISEIGNPSSSVTLSVPGRTGLPSPDPASAYISSIRVTADGPIGNTVGQALSSDRQSATLTYDGFVASAGPGFPSGEYSKFYHTAIELAVPQGESRFKIKLDMRGYVDVPSSELAIRRDTYTISASAGVVVIDDVPAQLLPRTFNTQISDDYIVSRTIDFQVSSTSSVGRLLLIVNSIIVATPNAQSPTQITQDSMDIEVSSQAVISNVAPTATLVTNSGVTYGNEVTATLANPFDPSESDVNAGLRYAFSINTDTTASATYATSSTSNTANFGYLNAGSYTVYGRIFDKDGGSTSYTTTLIVAKAQANIQINRYDVTYDGNEHRATGTVTGVAVSNSPATPPTDSSPPGSNPPPSPDSPPPPPTGPDGSPPDSSPPAAEAPPPSPTSNQAPPESGAPPADSPPAPTEPGQSPPPSSSPPTSSDPGQSPPPSSPPPPTTDPSQNPPGSGSPSSPTTVDLSAFLSLSSTAHVNAGTYTDTWTFHDPSGNYEDASGEVINVIRKAQTATVVTINGGPFTYTGAAHTPASVAVTGAGGLNLSPTATYVDNVNAGTATATYTYAGDDNHEGSSGSATFAIAKATSSTVITISGGPFTYTGFAQTPAVVNVTGVGELNLSPAATYVNNVDAGTATVTYTYVGDANHDGSTATSTFAIEKATSTTVITINGGPFTYTGTAQTPAVVSVTGAGGLSLSPTATYTNNINAGTATVTYTYAGDNNHTASTASSTFTIGKATAALTLGNLSQVYNGTPRPVTVISNATGGSTYTVLYNGSPTAPVAVGTYTVVATLVNPNFQGTVTGTLNVTLLSGSVFVLGTQSSGALSISGNGKIQTAGQVVVASNSSSAVSATGNAIVSATGGVLVSGGISNSGNARVTKSGSTGSMGDPLANLAAPPVAGLQNFGAVNISNGTVTLQPGIYSKINLSGNANVIFAPGTYIIAGGGFTMSGNAKATGTGVTIYNAGSNYATGGSGGTFGAINISGNANVNFTAPTTGAYAGILFFQARDNKQAVTLSGNGILSMSGALYASAASMSVSGNGDVRNLSILVSTLTISGNGRVS